MPLKGEFIINGETEEAEKETVAPKIDAEEAKSSGESEPDKKPSGNARFFSSLCVYPKNVTFENQDEDEEIILLVRRDLITNLPWMVTASLLVLIPPFISTFSFLFEPFFQLEPVTQLIATLFYYLLVIGFIIVQFTLWYFNVGLVTNKRIVDLDLSGILFKHVAETKLGMIEDVSYTQIGSIRSVFNYGDVHIQTAGTMANFEFDRAPEPARIVRIIGDLIGQ